MVAKCDVFYKQDVTFNQEQSEIPPPQQPPTGYDLSLLPQSPDFMYLVKIMIYYQLIG
jgi:hypothetical protein